MMVVWAFYPFKTLPKSIITWEKCFWHGKIIRKPVFLTTLCIGRSLLDWDFPFFFFFFFCWCGRQHSLSPGQLFRVCCSHKSIISMIALSHRYSLELNLFGVRSLIHPSVVRSSSAFRGIPSFFWRDMSYYSSKAPDKTCTPTTSAQPDRRVDRKERS